MPYITTAEKIGIEKGIQQGIQQVKSKLDDQVKKTSKLVVSADAISDRLSEIRQEIGGGFSKLSTGIQSLASGIYEGFIELSYQLELVREELEEIKEILAAPLSTEAKELRKRAEFAYLNGWIDEALVDLLESEEKNYQDFIVHQMIGNIYYFHKKDFPKAVEYFKKAAKYAAPVSTISWMQALFLLGKAYQSLGQLREAFQTTWQAFKEASEKMKKERVSSEQEAREWIRYLMLLQYQTAQYYALLLRYDKKAIKDEKVAKQEIIHLLKGLFLGDRDFCIAVDRDSAFDVMRSEVNELIKTFQEWVKTEAEHALKECKESFNDLQSVRRDLFALRNRISEIEEIYQRDSLFDYLKARQMALETHMEILSELREIKEVPYERIKEDLSRVKWRDYTRVEWFLKICTFVLLILLIVLLAKLRVESIFIFLIVLIMMWLLLPIVGVLGVEALKKYNISRGKRRCAAEESKLKPLWKKCEEIKARYESLRKAGNGITLLEEHKGL